MPRDVLARVHVEVIDELLALDSMRGGKSVEQCASRVVDTVDEEGVELDPVAGREHSVLEHLRATLCAEPERPETLAQLHGSRAMAEAEADEPLHENCQLYSRADQVVAGLKSRYCPRFGPELSALASNQMFETFEATRRVR